VFCAVSGAYSSTDLLFLLMTWLRILNCSIWWDFCHLLTYVPLLSLLCCIHYVNDSTAKETWRFTLVDSIDSIIVLPVQVIQELKRDLVWGVIDLQYWILGEGRMNLQHKHLTGWSNHKPCSSACRRCLVQTQALVGGIEPAHYLFQLKAWQWRH
jgi:hypothetical protein